VITVVFAAFLALSIMIALVDWRRGWLLAVLSGVLQDPARKLSAGAPVVMSLSIVLVYIAVLFASQKTLQRWFRDFTRRFPRVYGAAIVLLLALALAAVNGIMTFGLEHWKVPALSFFLYAVPIPAFILGYAYFDREQQIEGFIRFYAALTSVAMIGTLFEYFDFRWPALGTVAMTFANIRMMPGLEIRMLSGFYRAPDILAWHAATLCCIGVIMAMRRRTLMRAWPWMVVSGWAFLNCILSGRRKAVYTVATFALIFIWRYMRRLRISELITIAIVGLVMGGVVQQMMKSETTSVYARGTATTTDEILGRLEGGLSQTFIQSGFLGAGLGSATQGVQHISTAASFSWQEGGLGKLAIELGLPGLLAIAVLALAAVRVLLVISAHPDIPESSQVLRAGLFALFCGHFAMFLTSAQAYSDPLLALLTAFFAGSLFGTATLDERARQHEVDAVARAAAVPLPAVARI
jgi:hypothetical protein